MIVIQSLNTFGGARMAGGFETTRVLQDEISKSYETHKQYDYVMFTDTQGAKILNGIVPIEVIEFPIVCRDRIKYFGKFQAQSVVNEPYIHVDLDAELLELPTENCDVYCEKLEGRSFGKEINDLKIDIQGISEIPCSAIIGFNDLNFRDLYLKNVYEKVELLKTVPMLNYKHAWGLEEVLLARLIIDNKKTIGITKSNHYHNLK